MEAINHPGASVLLELIDRELAIRDRDDSNLALFLFELSELFFQLCSIEKPRHNRSAVNDPVQHCQ